jgi:hypothetical protein
MIARLGARIVLLALAVMVAAGLAEAAQTENAPVFKASQILGAAASGPDYTVDELVQSDGFLYIFQLQTSYGRFTVDSLDLMKSRVKELAALRILDKMSKSEAFMKSAGGAALAPLRYAGDMVTNPVGTLGDTFSGVGSFFSQVTAGVSNPHADPDSLIDSVSGASSIKRELAFKLGVDPYSDFPPLTKALNAMARAMAIGKLSVSLALSSVGGVAGLVVSSVNTANSASSLVLEKTPAELVDINRKRLTGLGVSESTANSFLANKFFTPTDLTTLVGWLMQMRGVEGIEVFVARAAQVDRRAMAVFEVRHAAMVAGYHQHGEAFASFVDSSGLPVNKTTKGAVVALLPFDILYLTPTANALGKSMTEDLRNRGIKSKLNMVISGKVSPLARRGFTQMGWKVVDSYR